MDIQLEHRIIDIVAQVLKKKSNEIIGTESFVELGADSLDMFEMILKFEDSFLIEISDQEIEKIKTIPHIIELVYQKKAF